jgi:hypothetical protein
MLDRLAINLSRVLIGIALCIEAEQTEMHEFTPLSISASPEMSERNHAQSQEAWHQAPGPG